MANKPCVEGLANCGGPLAAPGTCDVCNDCAIEYERMVEAGEVLALDFFVDAILTRPGENLIDKVQAARSMPEADDDGDYLDRKYTGTVR
jgi:hypothetical protein